MKDLRIMAAHECPQCKGAMSIMAGEHLVKCPTCDGAGREFLQLTLEELRRLLAEEPSTEPQ